MISTEKLKKMSDVLQMISDDTEKDVKHFEGQPFNGRTLGELHGNLSASVDALAKTLKTLIDERLEESEDA